MQDVQAFDVGQDSTTLEYSAPHQFSVSNAGAACSDQMRSYHAVWSAKDGQVSDRGMDQRGVSCSAGNRLQGQRERSVDPPHLAVERENRFLKARVEELEAENVKVGEVISDLRHELETAGVLQRLKGGIPAPVESPNLELDKPTHLVLERHPMPR